MTELDQSAARRIAQSLEPGQTAAPAQPGARAGDGNARERFEAYFLDSRKSKGAGRAPSFERFPDDTYKDDHTQRHWWTWQQALAAAPAASAPAALMPLTDERLDAVLSRFAGGCEWSDDEYDAAAKLARLIEAAHGIQAPVTAQAEGG